jgi:NAD(P)-dependent dehydrogenase (short-subunit alcohol dehydrogenase family)
VNQLRDKVAVITGGNSGIGLATAKAFAREGAQVIITGRRPEALDEAVAEIGNGAIAIAGDVSQPAQHHKVVAQVRQQFSKVDIYVSNAGANTIEPTASVTEQSFDAQFAINTRGVFFGVQKMLPILRDGGGIILISSIASEKVLDGHAVYAGTKAAINAFARSWSIELRERRIRVNVLSPGPIKTAILEKLGIPADERPKFEMRMAAAIPAGRMGEADEVAAAALFLASEASAFVNGVNLRVDGGMALL